MRPKSNVLKNITFILAGRSPQLMLLVSAILFSVLLFFTTRLAGSDDTVFPNDVAKFQSALEWVTFRYENWSGRYFSELFTYFFSSRPLILWKIASILCFIIFSLSLYGYYRLLSNKPAKRDALLMAGLAGVVFYLINVNVIYDGTFWISGGMNYFWISSLAVAGFYPVAHSVVRAKTPNVALIGLCLIAALIGSTTEQSGTVLLALCGAFLAYGVYAWKKEEKTFPLIPLLFFITVLFAWTVMILAPGNEIRTASETATWLPQLATTSEVDKLDYRTRWFVNALVNHSGFLLGGVFATLGIVAFSTLKRYRKSTAYPLGAAAILAISNGVPAVSTFVEFSSQWGTPVQHRVVYLALLFWIVIFVLSLLTCVALFIQTKSRAWIVVGLVLGAAYASTAIVTLSPTLYVSGVRTFFVPSLLLAIVLYVIVGIGISNYKNWRETVVPALVFVGCVAYLYMFLLLRGPSEMLTPYLT